MIQLTQGGVVSAAGDVQPLATEFQRKGFVQFKNLLDPRLLSLIVEHLARGDWRSIQGGFYTEDKFEGLALEALRFAFNRPAFLQLASTIGAWGLSVSFKVESFAAMRSTGTTGIPT